MLLFIGFLWCGFRYVGQALRLREDAPVKDQFLVWSLGASLFAHAATCTSVAYFDQTFLFLYSALAMVVSLRQGALTTVESSAPAHADHLKPNREFLIPVYTTPSDHPTPAVL